MGVTSFLLLGCLGLSITTQAQDCTKPVGGPNMSIKNGDILLQVFPDGSQVSFTCDVGYTSAGGSGTSTCFGGTWTPLTLKCEMVTCGLPPMVVNGTFSPIKESYVFGDSVQYSCQNDFTLNGSVSVSCSDDGTFQPAPPTCIRVQCEEPVIENAEWVSGSRPPYGHKATSIHRCNSGFKMIGSPTIVCDINSQWSPKLPTCEMVTCSPPLKVDHGSFSPGKESYNYGNVVQYSCQTGFILSGSKSLSCSEDGTFKPVPPTCIMASFEYPEIEEVLWDPL